MCVFGIALHAFFAAGVMDVPIAEAILGIIVSLLRFAVEEAEIVEAMKK